MRITGEHAPGEEAAAVVRQAVSMAARRGHAQVTPLHIASAMLSGANSAGIFRAACVRTQSHPLQHNALDLCLNLALDRLKVAPAVADPVPTNAFTAALKRAKAQGRRRGDKVEIRQLVLSILDDPSVDRVMRAAGFSSSQLVRASVENNAAGLSEQPDTAPTSLHTDHGTVVANAPDHHGSEIQASQAKSGPASHVFFDGSKVVAIATTAIPLPWLRGHKETVPATRSAGHGGTTNLLQVDLAARGETKFTELTAQNLKILCDALELACPGHGDIVSGISSTVLLCRSGMAKRRGWKQHSPLSRMTWLLFLGRDADSKLAVARELARLVFGARTEFTTLQEGNSDGPSRIRKLNLKRGRSPGDDDAGYAGERLFEVIIENPHRVIYIDGIDRLDRGSKIRINDAIMEGKVRGCNGDVVGMDDAIVVMCSDVLNSRSEVSCHQVKRRQLEEEGDVMGKEVRPRHHPGLDLNAFPENGEDDEDILADGEAIQNSVDGVFLFN